MTANTRQPRVLLLNPPGSRRYQRDTFCSSVAKGRYCFPPGDLILLSGSFDDDVRIDVLDALAEGIGADGLAARVRPADHDLVVLQISSASWPEDRPVLERLVREGARVVLNGDYARMHAARLVADGSPAHGVVLDMLAGGLDALVRGDGAPAGVLLRGDGRAPAALARGAPAPLRPRHALFPLRRYHVPFSLRRPITTMYGSVGCAQRCEFCFARRVPHRARAVDEVVAEMAAARRAGAREVAFFDPLFNGRPSHALALCDAIRRARLDVTWSCFSRVDHIGDAIAAAWKAAGCHTVMLGLESGSDALLARMGKRQTTADARAAVARLRRHGLRVGAFFLLGYEGETDEDIRRTIRFATELDLAFASFQLVVPFDTTPLAERVRRERGDDLDFAGFDDGDRPFSLDPARSPAHLRALREEAYRTFYLRPGFIARRALMVRSLAEARTLLREGLRLALRR